VNDPIVIEATFYAHELPKDGQETITFAVDQHSRKEIKQLSRMKGLLYIFVVAEEDYDTMLGVEQ
jgi:hypothetical protein